MTQLRWTQDEVSGHYPKMEPNEWKVGLCVFCLGFEIIFSSQRSKVMHKKPEQRNFEYWFCFSPKGTPKIFQIIIALSFNRPKTSV